MIASRLFYWLILFGIIPGVASFWLPQMRNIVLLYDALLVFALAVDALLTRGANNLTAVRFVADRLSIGRNNKVEIEVYNQSDKALKLQVCDDYPQEIETDTTLFAFDLAARSRAVLTYNLLPRSRGAYKFGNINIRYLSTLKLFWRQKKVKAELAVKVYSDLIALQELAVKLTRASELGEMKLKKRGQGTDFSSLREYNDGDDVRKVDWKATARRDSPAVRVYEVEREQTLMILLDAGRMMVSELDGLSRFDHALNSALSLAMTGLYKNDQVGFGIFADKPLLYMQPRRGKIYLNKILEAVADVKPRIVEPDYTGALSYFASVHKQRSLIVVLTDLIDPLGSQALLSGLASLSAKHLTFCVTLKDKRIDEIAASRELAAESLFKRAVASDTISQRETALSHLQRRGCLILDAAPRDLSDKLINKYLEIKTRGLL